MENDFYLKFQNGRVMLKINHVDMSILSFILSTGNCDFLLLDYKKIIEYTKLELSENELFARLQNLSNLGLIEQRVINIFKDGEKKMYLGYRCNRDILEKGCI